MTKRQLVDYIAERLSVEPDYPWEKLTDGYVCRRPDTRNLFGCLRFGPMIATWRFFGTLNRIGETRNRQNEVSEASEL